MYFISFHPDIHNKHLLLHYIKETNFIFLMQHTIHKINVKIMFLMYLLFIVLL